MVHSGDFLLTNSMSFGRPYILKVDGCIHDGWLVISQSTEIFDQDYLYWLLSSNYAYMQFCGKVSGAVVKNLNSDKVAIPFVGQLLSPHIGQELTSAIQAGAPLLNIGIGYFDYRNKISPEKADGGFSYIIKANRDGIIHI